MRKRLLLAPRLPAALCGLRRSPRRTGWPRSRLRRVRVRDRVRVGVRVRDWDRARVGVRVKVRDRVKVRVHRVRDRGGDEAACGGAHHV